MPATRRIHRVLVTALLCCLTGFCAPSFAEADVLIEEPPSRAVVGDSVKVGYWYQTYSGGPRWFRIRVGFRGRIIRDRKVRPGASWRYYRFRVNKAGKYTVRMTGPGFDVRKAVRVRAAAQSAASYRRCSGTYRAPNGLGLVRIQAKRVSCATARKTTVSWGRAWTRAEGANVVRFTRVHSWRCMYRFVAFPEGGGYGRVICAASGGLRVAFRAPS